ncbi:MAG: zinc-binding dehydrogenase [Anaerolineales bacterium]|nr:zinc-binding dehydrogenase [Anaerolineales bacterium]
MSNDTMRRAILAGPEQIDIEETPLGEPGPDEVLVKTRACAICTWEKRAYTGADTRFYPLLGGHEISGVVKAIGEDAGDGLEVGDSVSVSGLTRCGKCYSCRMGRDNRCDNTWQKGFKPGTPIGPGGLASHKMAKAYQIFKVPADTDLIEVSLAEPLACVLRSIKKAQVEAGDFVVVAGGGVMGMLHLRLAKRRGATVIVSEPDEGRRQRALGFGADHVLDPAEDDLVESVKEITAGRGAQAIFDAVGKVPILESAIGALGKGGRLHVYARVYPKGEPITIDPNIFHDKEIVLTGTMSQSREDYVQAAEMIARHAIDLQPLISETYPMAQIKEAFEASTRLENYRIVVTM